MRLARFSFLILAAGICLAQVGSVENAASNIPPGLPNSNIAQGAMFVVKGTNLGPPETVVDNDFPLGVTLSGTSVRITSAGQTRDAIIYYTQNRQIAAILPSSTPIGAASLEVTYNGRTARASIDVVASNIGLYTVNSSGSGPAVATFQSPSVVAPYLSNGNAAMPGDVVNFWGTGLGAVNSDETLAAISENMTHVPVEAYIGGKQAEVLYRGRSGCCSSVDVVSVRIPQGVAGCLTPVTMQIGDLVSNTATIPVGAGSRTCAPANPAITQSLLDRLSSRQSYTAGAISLTKSSIVGSAPGGNPEAHDEGSASFSRVDRDLLAAFYAQFDIPPAGSCAVHSYNGLVFKVPSPEREPIEAGAAIAVNGPNGSGSLLPIAGQPGAYYANLSPSASFLSPGQYTVSASGGAAGSFLAHLAVAPPLVWTNASDSTVVSRASGLHLTWMGGDPNALLRISGQAFIDYSRDGCCGEPVGAHFTCTAKVADRSFTIPPAVLLALPVTSPNGGLPGSGRYDGGVLVLTATDGSLTTAGGLDFLAVSSDHTIAQFATFR